MRIRQIDWVDFSVSPDIPTLIGWCRGWTSCFARNSNCHDLNETDAIIFAVDQHGVMIDVAGQFHRWPLEQIKLKLIRCNLGANRISQITFY